MIKIRFKKQVKLEVKKNTIQKSRTWKVKSDTINSIFTAKDEKEARSTLEFFIGKERADKLEIIQMR